MSRQFVVCAVLFVAVLAGSAFAPGRFGPAAAHQATPAAATDCPTSTPEENEAVVQRYYDEVYNGQDLAVIDELLSDDFVRHNVAAPQDNQPGHADDKARVESWLSAFPDLQISIEDLYASPDTVVSYVLWSGTQDGPLPQWGAPATGRPMERESLVVWRIACGKLAENWIVQDNLTMLRQLGIISDEELATAGTPTVATPTP
jgi:predicted ester cyclase